MKHWHPLFAKSLRPLVEAYYDVDTDVAVGDVPRQADIVLLRRTAEGPLPFQGLWRHLTTWNVLEYKGPTVSPRVRDLDALVELGLGIDRRLNESRTRERARPLSPCEVSFWYLANRLGHRFLRAAGERSGVLKAVSEGLWQATVLLRPVLLVSGVELPVERDSVPLHVIGQEPRPIEHAVGRFIATRPDLWAHYGNGLATFHFDTWMEVQTMAKGGSRAAKTDYLRFLNHLTREDIEISRKSGSLQKFLEEFIGTENVVAMIGLKKLIQQIGPEKLIQQIGVDGLLAKMSPAQRRELKRQLQEQS